MASVKSFLMCVVYFVLLFHLGSSQTGLVTKPKKGDNLFESIIGTGRNLFDAAKFSWPYIVNSIKNIQNAEQSPDFIDTKDYPKTVGDIIKDLGFGVENYNVETEDGYILGLQRIVNRRNSTSAKSVRKPVVFIQHGFLCSSSIFLLNENADENLPTILADHGYDVWMGNYRGNSYSSKHTKLSENDPEFWKFSWDEMASKDLPAMIDFVLRKTKKRKLSYVGHSMGGGTIIALLASIKRYQSKINVVAALSPAARISKPGALLSAFYQFHKYITVLSELLGTKGKMLPNIRNATNSLGSDCRNNVVNVVLCQSVYSIWLTATTSNINKTRLPFMYTQFPDTTSTYTYGHFCQELEDGNFQKYDFGKEKNLEIYNQEDPPKYYPEKVATPVGLFSSEMDSAVSETDIDFLREKLPNVVENFVMEKNMNYSHFDMVLATNANKLLYPSVVSLLDKYKN